MPAFAGLDGALRGHPSGNPPFWLCASGYRGRVVGWKLDSTMVIAALYSHAWRDGPAGQRPLVASSSCRCRLCIRSRCLTVRTFAPPIEPGMGSACGHARSYEAPRTSYLVQRTVTHSMHSRFAGAQSVLRAAHLVIYRAPTGAARDASSKASS